MDLSILRILDTHDAKNTKKQTRLVCFASLFYNQTVFHKLKRSF